MAGQLAKEWFLRDTPQELLGLRIHRQDRVHAQAQIFLAIANWR
jgi:hypothetical protein